METSVEPTDAMPKAPATWDLGERASVAALVTSLTLLSVGLSRSMGQPGLRHGEGEFVEFVGLLVGPQVGAWVARRVLRGGRRYYATLLVFAAWIGMATHSVTLPRTPVSVWGGPLRLTPAAVAWMAGCIFVMVLIATTGRRSERNGRTAGFLDCFWAFRSASLFLSPHWSTCRRASQPRGEADDGRTAAMILAMGEGRPPGEASRCHRLPDSLQVEAASAVRVKEVGTTDLRTKAEVKLVALAEHGQGKDQRSVGGQELRVRPCPGHKRSDWPDCSAQVLALGRQ